MNKLILVLGLTLAMVISSEGTTSDVEASPAADGGTY